MVYMVCFFGGGRGGVGGVVFFQPMESSRFAEAPPKKR